MLKRNILMGAALVISASAAATHSVKRNELLQMLFKEIDGKQIGEAYLAAFAAKDENAMIRAVADYYRNRPESVYLQRKIKSRDYSAETAERAVRNDFTVVNIPWQFTDGINWIFNPTWKKTPVSNEWLWQLGRMYFWHDMIRCYQENGADRFAKAFEYQVRSWMFQADKKKAVAGPYGHNTWRTIEAGIRLLYSWPAAFEVFRKAPDVSDETLCLMLASMFEQAEYLRHNHRKKSNWLLMEMSGVYTFASVYPEFKKSKQFRIYASGVFGKAFCSQMMPDGMHDELSPDYLWVSLRTAKNFVDQAQLAGRMDELPEKLTKDFEAGYDAFAALATPGLTAPRTNDCYTLHLPGVFNDILENFPERELFKWVASDRKAGRAPEDKPGASRFLPYAGFIVMRSGWDKDALYCCFDVGPLGMGHWHWDKLNINVWKGKDELIYDDGGGLYELSPFRFYGRSGADHNTVLVDGMGQMRYLPKKVNKPIDAGFVSNEKFDYAKSSYTDTFGLKKFDGTDDELAIPLFKPATHTREVRFCKPEFFCVVDTLRSADGKLHDYELRFQLDTLKTRKVRRYPGAVISDYDNKEYDILILPLYPEKIETSTASGRRKPLMAGWFIGRNDLTRHKATTVMMSAKQQKNFTFATLLIPIRKGGALPEVKSLGKKRFSVTVNGKCFEIDLAGLNR